MRSASELSLSTTAVSSASLSWVSRFLPQGNLGGLLGAVCEAVHSLVNFFGRIMFSGRRCPAADRDAGMPRRSASARSGRCGESGLTLIAVALFHGSRHALKRTNPHRISVAVRVSILFGTQIVMFQSVAEVPCRRRAGSTPNSPFCFGGKATFSRKGAAKTGRPECPRNVAPC